MLARAMTSKLHPQTSIWDNPHISSEGIAAVFDDSPVGILCVDVLLNVTYANRLMLQIAGLVDWRGKKVRDLIPDEANFKKVTERFEKRRRGLSEEYEIELTRSDNGQHIPVMIAATPLTDNDGEVVGAISVIRSIAVEKAIQAFDKHLEQASTTTAVLHEIANQAIKLIPYEYCAASSYSDDLKRARVLFSDDRGIGFASRTKWYDISPITQGLLEQRTVTLISDLPEFFCRQGLNESPDRTIKSFLARGFRSMIRYPVFRNGRLVASYSFFNTRPDGFDETHRKIVQALPIDSALITALNYQTTSELGFRFDLLKKLVACHENRRLSGLLVKEIFAYYQWANVSIFDVDTLTDSIVLNNQKAVSKHFQLPAKHRQRLDKGLLGLAYRQGQAVNVGNVEEGVFREHFIKACPLTVSELCIPLRANGRIVALLNIEDHHENAFSPEEVRSLEVLLDEAGAVFERIRRDNVGRAAFQTTPSAVFVIDKLGMVRSANPAASRLLGYSEPLEGKNLGELFQDKALGEAFVAADNAVSKEVILLRADGSPVSVLMGGSLLGAQFEGERVISAKDLQGYIRSEETKFLGQIYYEIATQYKTPLALVFSWLKMLRESESDLVMDVVEKCLRQLNKIELTIDRLALFDKSRPAPSYDPALIDLRELFRNITDDFPLAERKRIKFEWLGETYLIRGDSFQLSFVFKTILSYFIRSSASDQSDITVQCVGGKEEIAICLKGPWAGLIARDHGRRRSDAVLSRILWEMAFGEEAIARFLKNHHAQVEQEELPDTCHRSYTIRFFAAIPEVYQ